VGEELRQVAWDGLALAHTRLRLVLIVPDGALQLVNFAAMPAGSSRFLGEQGPLLHVLSAERDIVRRRADPEGPERLLAIGSPDFDRLPSADMAHGTPDSSSSASYRGARSSCGDFRTLRFGSLPQTSAEIDEITSAWLARPAGAHSPGGPPEHRSAVPLAADSSGLVELLGVAASEAGFKLEAPRCDLLHVATHGFFLRGTCSPAAGGRGVTGLVSTNLAAPGAGESPLVLSGLALAGANRRDRARADEEDGILTAEEIAALDLHRVRWAVLSACETALGEVHPGEGVFGLRRAFQTAGAGTLIMSLWPVDDRLTRQWMHELYRARFERGRSTVEAVAEASRALLRIRRAGGQSVHPFYWASFLATGGWE
jgi:CHAT domain-containing protein